MMRRNLCLICRGAVFALALLLPAIAQAESEIYHFRGNRADANVRDGGFPGCINTWVDISFMENRTQYPPGSPNEDAGVLIYVSQFDLCQYTTLMHVYGYGVVPEDAFKMQGNLQSARLSTTIQVYDSINGVTLPLVIDLTWTGIGEVTRTSRSVRSVYPDYMFRSRSHGDYREADVSGSIAVGALNLTVVPATTVGNLYDSTGGYVSVVH